MPFPLAPTNAHRLVGTLLLALAVTSCGEGSSGSGGDAHAAGEGVAVRGAPAPRLLLLVTVDTLRADRLGAYGSDRALTPHLDALAEESLVFEAAYAPASFTLPSVSALLTGRYPEELGIWNNHSGVPDVPSLASTLRERGWSTAAVVSNYVLRRTSGVEHGFDVFDDSMPVAEVNRPDYFERTASATTDAALSALERCAENARCLLWVHYQDPHGPYTPPEGLRERFLERERREPDGRRELPVRDDQFGRGGMPAYQALGEEREVAFYRAGYDAEILYADREIGRLLAGVFARVPPHEALVIFAADHGEALGEDDTWFAHGHDLTDALVRVPLFVRLPDGEPARRDDVVSIVDLFPTLVRHLAGEGVDAAYPGRDLFAEDASSRQSVVYLATLGGITQRRFGLVDGGFKLIVSERDDVWDARLFRRGREDVDLAAPLPQVVARMRRGLDALRSSLEPVAAPERELDAEERARLEALGYVDREP